MAKPPSSPPSSDIRGVHRDRAPQNDAEIASKSNRAEREARASDSPGTPGGLDAGEGRGEA